jgi:hypothetical protein
MTSTRVGLPAGDALDRRPTSKDESAQDHRPNCNGRFDAFAIGWRPDSSATKGNRRRFACTPTLRLLREVVAERVGLASVRPL